jgi:hypothetical protein
VPGEQPEEGSPALACGSAPEDLLFTHRMWELLNRLVEQSNIVRLGVDAAGRVFPAPQALELGHDQWSPVKTLGASIKHLPERWLQESQGDCSVVGVILYEIHDL